MSARPDPERARQAVVELGGYFKSQERLRAALGVGPDDWFQGGLPSARALRRIESFLLVARELDAVSGDPVRTGRYLAAKSHRSSLERRRRREVIIERGRTHFQRNRADYVPPRSEWTKTLAERHPGLAELPLRPEDRQPLAPEALSELLAELVA